MSLERRQNPTAAMPHAFPCLRCGSAIKPGRKFCSQCGAPAGFVPARPQTGFVGRLSVCPECGFENYRSDRFCKVCGELLAAAPSGRLTLDAIETHVAHPLVEEPEELRSEARVGAPPAREVEPPLASHEEAMSPVPATAAEPAVEQSVAASVEPPPASDVEPSPSSTELEAAPATAAEPAAEPFPAPAHEPAMPEPPAFLQEASLQGESASHLRPGILALATLALLLIVGAILLYSTRAAGSAAQPVSLSSRGMAATTSLPSFAAVAASRADAEPLRVDGSVQASKILSAPVPTYPAGARDAGTQGVVRLEAVIAKDGTVRDLKVISGNRMLAEAAVSAVRHWRYQATELDGQPIEVRTDINVDFRIP
jgi:TonB family protein